MATRRQSYHAAVRELRARAGGTYRQAQAAYRTLKAELGRPATGADVRRHPKLADRAIRSERAQRGAATRRARQEQRQPPGRTPRERPPRERPQERIRRPPEGEPAAGGPIGRPAPAREEPEAEEEPEAPPEEFEGIEDWLDSWDSYDGDYDVYDVEAGIDYGPSKK